MFTITVAHKGVSFCSTTTIFHGFSRQRTEGWSATIDPTGTGLMAKHEGDEKKILYIHSTRWYHLSKSRYLAHARNCTSIANCYYGVRYNE